jgi:two-component system OmpR family sensor kinase
MSQAGLDPARALVTLERLLEIEAPDLESALTHAANALSDAFAADKVDAFLYDDRRDSLVALGTSTQPLSDLQRNLGLDVLPISNGGRVVYVYKTDKVFRTGNLLADPGELTGVKEGLKIKSKLGVPLHIGSKVRGMIMIASLQGDFFTESDESFVKAAASWVGVVAHRAELMEEISRSALEQGRRSAAEELVTVLAHDIRNYLAPVSGWVYLLRNNSQVRGDEQGLRHADAALRSIKSLSALVTNLLDVARIDRGLFDLDVEPVDLGAISREAAESLSTDDHHVVVRASSPVIVRADRARLRQCLDNLISNAAGHSPKGAPVNLFARQYEREGHQWAELKVVDEGPGVPEDVMPHIFDRFVTGRSGTGGVGLGLYVANRIAQAHGGKIEVESSPGKGARFNLHLPVYRAPDPDQVSH